MINKTQQEESEVARCRRVRNELDRQFKTADEALEFLREFERAKKRTVARSSRSKQPKPRTPSPKKSTVRR